LTDAFFDLARSPAARLPLVVDPLLLAKCPPLSISGLLAQPPRSMKGGHARPFASALGRMVRALYENPAGKPDFSIPWKLIA
jgi:hypothetical protein